MNKLEQQVSDIFREITYNEPRISYEELSKKLAKFMKLKMRESYKCGVEDFIANEYNAFRDYIGPLRSFQYWFNKKYESKKK